MEGFGYSLTPTDPKVRVSGKLDDSRTDISDGSCDGLFKVPLKTMGSQLKAEVIPLPASQSCMDSNESHLGVASPPPTAVTPTERSESPASEEWGFISSDYHVEEPEEKVREWRGCSDAILGGVSEPWPSKGDEDGDREVNKL
jgi:hypothetical protein